MSHCANAAKGCIMWGFGGIKQCECACDVCVADTVSKRPIKGLIAKSSIGAGLRDIEERGIDAHLADLDAEMAPKRRRKR